MTRHSDYTDLMGHIRTVMALGQASGLLGWDQETMMPKGAAGQRSEVLAELEGVLHGKRTDPRIGEWLAALDGGDPDPVAAANLRHIRREYDRATRTPAALAKEIARARSVAQGIWAEARAADDFAAFAPSLQTVLDLRRQEAACLADGGDLYDAMLSDYEPGMTGARLEEILFPLRDGLVSLRDRILGADDQVPNIAGHFPEAQQMALAADLATAFGYDWTRGRIDKAVHPFSSGSGNDARITTRVDEADPFNCLYSTIHEVGHACYEQGISPDHLLTPLGQGVSMGVHESQSRLYENQLGRSEAFCGWLYDQMRVRFGDFGIDSPREFYRAVNAVRRGYIRTEADEVQYNLHVLLRFELERALISGSLEVADLEEAWNSAFLRDFGYPVDRASNGVLQDVHWSVGLFGYFPTYSLGNLYAGCLHAALCQETPDLDTALAKGQPSPATRWLHDKVQVHGGLYEPAELIETAAGQSISEAPLLSYLDAKFTDLYNL